MSKTETLPAGMHQRKDTGAYTVDYTDQSGTRHRRSFKTFEAAHARLKQLQEADGEGGVNEHGKVRTLQDALDLALKRWDKQRAPLTQLKNAKAAIDFFGEKLLVEFTVADIRAYKAHLVAKGNGDGTINRKLSARSVMFKEAIDEGAITSMPQIKRVREVANRIRFLTAEEEAKLDALIRYVSEEAADICLFLIDTGLRVQQEGLAVEVHHMVRDRTGKVQLLVTDGKGGKARSIYLTARAETIAAKYTEQAKEAGRSLLFSLNYDALYRIFVTARRKLELDDVTIHTLRHTCASRMAQRGVALQVIKAWMGHTSINTTMRYVHLATEHLVSAVEAMEQ